MPLTDTAIRGSKPADRPFKIYDRDGLFLLINPNGSKLWRWRYRADGKEKLMALGEYPIVGLAEVRERHLAARKKLANGIDPMDEWKADAATKQESAKALLRQAESSFEKIARKWWASWSIGKSPRHADGVNKTHHPKQIFYAAVIQPARLLSIELCQSCVIVFNCDFRAALDHHPRLAS